MVRTGLEQRGFWKHFTKGTFTGYQTSESVFVCEHMCACMVNIHLCPWDSLFFKMQAEGRVTVYIVSDEVLPVLTPILLASEKKIALRSK